MMNETAIKEIESLTINSHLKKDARGIEWVRKGEMVPLVPVHEPTVKVSTLASFSDFIVNNPQKLNLEGAIVVINSDFTVDLLSAPSEVDKERTILLRAKAYEFEPFRFSYSYDLESFIVALKTKFVMGEDWEVVFNLVRKVQISEGVELEDDGMSQKVTVKNGVSAASITKKDVKTDYVLTPIRIFPECSQPSSIFFLRIKGDKESGVIVSLHETDGGKWKVDAAKNVAEYIRPLIPGGLQIYY